MNFKVSIIFTTFEYPAESLNEKLEMFAKMDAKIQHSKIKAIQQ